MSNSDPTTPERQAALKAVEPTTSVPLPHFTDRGLSLPDPLDVLTGTITDMNAGFGNRLAFFDRQNRFLLSRPQGQIVTTQTAIIDDFNGYLQYYVNQVDPTVASGKMQDGIGKIYFLYRKAAQATVVNCLCTGAPGTVIAQGSKAKDGAGNVYSALGTATISANATVNLSFACDVKGPIECPAGSLNQIYQIIPGWDSITNPEDGITGQNEESRAQFEERRRESTAQNAVNSLSSILGKVRQLDGVIDAYVTDNPFGYTDEKGGVSLKPHSLYVCVAGGSDTDIAKAIWNKKPPGCDMNGDTTVTVVDDQNGYAAPLPTYDITFQRAKSTPLIVRVEMSRAPGRPNDAEIQIKQAVMNNFTGADGSVRVRIGGSLVSSRFYASIQNLGSWASIYLIGVGRAGQALAVEVDMNIDEIPTLTLDNIEVVFQ